MNGFVAGTLVHTDRGLVSIQDIRIGDRVLSRHENGEGKLAYKYVTKIFKKVEQPIGAIVASIQIDESENYKDEFILSTRAVAFYAIDYLKYDKDKEISGEWVAINSTDNNLIDFNRKIVGLCENRELFRTNETHKAFYKVNPDWGRGIFLDVEAYKDNKLVVPDYMGNDALEVDNVDENGNLIMEKFRTEDLYGRDLWIPYMPAYFTTIYNFEVEDFKTYFIGNIGIWVHQ